MPILNIPSLGRFRVPEGTTQEEQDELIRGLVAMSGVQPKGPQGIGEVFSNAVARGAKQMLVGTAYDLPALGLAGLAKLGFSILGSSLGLLEGSPLAECRNSATVRAIESSVSLFVLDMFGIFTRGN